jgi:hypothetical protein
MKLKWRSVWNEAKLRPDAPREMERVNKRRKRLERRAPSRSSH